jgi:site-specific recombinase XerC
VGEFLAWCESKGVSSLAAVQPLHVASWIEQQGREVAAPSVKQQLAAIRHLFDWLVTGQVVPANPAASVRGPRHVVRSGKTPVLEPEGSRRLLTASTLLYLLANWPGAHLICRILTHPTRPRIMIRPETPLS